MARQQWAVGGGVQLGLLVLAMAGRADEAAAVKMIEELGGRVTVVAKRPGKPVVGVFFYRSKVTDAGLKELKELKSLRSLDLTETQVTDVGLKELKELKSLKDLDLRGTRSRTRG